MTDWSIYFFAEKGRWRKETCSYQKLYMDKQKELLAAAMKLFVEFGFHGTPTSKIAKEAGVANGTLFHYYKTKDDLIVALYVDIKMRMAGCLMTGLENESSIKGKMKSLYLSTMYWAMDNQYEFRFIQQFHSSPFLSKVTPEEIKDQATAHLRMIEDGIAQKIIKPLPVDFIYTLIMSHVFGVYQYLTTNEMDAEKRKAVIEETFEMLWNMIS